MAPPKALLLSIPEGCKPQEFKWTNYVAEYAVAETPWGAQINGAVVYRTRKPLEKLGDTYGWIYRGSAGKWWVAKGEEREAPFMWQNIGFIHGSTVGLESPTDELHWEWWWMPQDQWLNFDHAKHGTCLLVEAIAPQPGDSPPLASGSLAGRKRSFDALLRSASSAVESDDEALVATARAAPFAFEVSMPDQHWFFPGAGQPPTAENRPASWSSFALPLERLGGARRDAQEILAEVLGLGDGARPTPMRWWPPEAEAPSATVALTTERFALLTEGDGNCLLHAVSLAMWGFHARNAFQESGEGNLLRLLLHRMLLRQEFERDGMLRFEQAQANARVPEEFRITEDADVEWRRLVDESKIDKAYLGPLHVYGLSAVLRRPIIIYENTEATVRRFHPDTGQGMTGIYLPMRWPPQFCCREPLCLAYTGGGGGSGHFTALVFAEGRPKRAPLVDHVKGNLLPVRFLPGSSGGADGNLGLLQQYLDLEFDREDRRYPLAKLSDEPWLLPAAAALKEAHVRQLIAQQGECAGALAVDDEAAELELAIKMSLEPVA